MINHKSFLRFFLVLMLTLCLQGAEVAVPAPAADRILSMLKPENYSKLGEYLASLPYDQQQAKVNFADSRMNCPLHYALQYPNNLKTIDLLLWYGACALAKNKLGQTPLHVAADLKKNDEMQVLLNSIAELLEQYPAHIDVEDSDGVTPLMYAVSRPGNGRIVQLLKEWGADLNHKDKKGLDILDYAMMTSGNQNMVYKIFMTDLMWKPRTLNLDKDRQRCTEFVEYLPLLQEWQDTARKERAYHEELYRNYQEMLVDEISMEDYVNRVAQATTPSPTLLEINSEPREFPSFVLKPKALKPELKTRPQGLNLQKITSRLPA